MSYIYKRPSNRRNDNNAALIIIILILLIAIGVLVYVLLNSGTEPGPGPEPGPGGSDGGSTDININTGKLEIDISDTEGNSVVGTVLNFVVDDDQDAYFQPGASFYTQGFQVRNTGTIAVDFYVFISENADADMDFFKQGFEFYVTTDPENTQAEEKLTSFSGRLAAGEKSETYYLVVKMKETADNDYQDMTFSGIAITVSAEQTNA